MEKKLRVLFTIIMASVMLFALAVPASAQTFDFEQALEEKSPIQTLWLVVDEEHKKTFLDNVEDFGAVLYSSDESVVVTSEDGTYKAVGEGEAYIAVVFPNGAFNLYKCDVEPRKSSGTIIDDGNINNNISEGLGGINQEEWLENQKNEQNEFFDSIKEKQEDEIHVMEILGPILILLVVSLVLAEIGYIFVTAPKCGMSRLWALAPVVGNVFGLVVFLVLRSVAKQNTATTKNVIVCPVCNGRHPYGTDVCSICGTKLSK